MKGLLMGTALFLADQVEIQHKNKEKVQECVDRYFDAAKYPRKLKKKIRKRANKDYQFWTAIGEWHNNLLPLGNE